MPPPAALTVSRQLIRNLQTLIAFARELIRQSRWGINQQTSLQIVCAWCQQTIHWQRAVGAARGQISHSICLDCFANVYRELDRINPLSPFSKKA